MLTEKINAPNLAWTPANLRPEALRVDLPPQALEELRAGEECLARLGAAIPPAETLSRFPQLASALAALRESHLRLGYGAFLISGEPLGTLADAAQAAAYRLMAQALGPLQGQNAAQDLTVAVRDEHQRMGQGGRYHKSNEGGELHTDAPQYARTPAYVGLHCVRPASVGGTSKLVSAYAVHNALLEASPAALALLYDNYHFHQKPGPRTIQAPIFSQEGGGLSARYLGEYVRSGHQVAARPLDMPHAEALAALDALLADEERFAAQFDLRAGDVFIFDNRRLFHGRSAFVDEPGQPGRELTRVWIGEPF